MARKKFKAKKADTFEPVALYAAFAKEVFTDRTTAAVRLYEGKDNRGNIELEYDDS